MSTECASRHIMGSGITKPISETDSHSSVSSGDNDQYNDELAEKELEKELVIMNSITNTNFTGQHTTQEPPGSVPLVVSTGRSSVEEHLSVWFEHTAGLEVMS